MDTSSIPERNAGAFCEMDVMANTQARRTRFLMVANKRLNACTTVANVVDGTRRDFSSPARVYLTNATSTIERRYSGFRVRLRLRAARGKPDV